MEKWGRKREGDSRRAVDVWRRASVGTEWAVERFADALFVLWGATRQGPIPAPAAYDFLFHNCPAQKKLYSHETTAAAFDASSSDPAGSHASTQVHVGPPERSVPGRTLLTVPQRQEKCHHVLARLPCPK